MVFLLAIKMSAKYAFCPVTAMKVEVQGFLSSGNFESVWFEISSPRLLSSLDVAKYFLLSPFWVEDSGLFPGSMHTEHVSKWSWIRTIVSVKSIAAVSMIRLMLFYGSFSTVASFGCRVCTIISFKGLNASSMRSSMLVIVYFKSVEVSDWGLMSIVTF